MSVDGIRCFMVASGDSGPLDWNFVGFTGESDNIDKFRCVNAILKILLG